MILRRAIFMTALLLAGPALAAPATSKLIDDAHRRALVFLQHGAQGDIGDKPMVRLVNQPKGATAIPVDFGVVNADPQTVAFVRGLYPRARTVAVDSDH